MTAVLEGYEPAEAMITVPASGAGVDLVFALRSLGTVQQQVRMHYHAVLVDHLHTQKVSSRNHDHCAGQRSRRGPRLCVAQPGCCAAAGASLRPPGMRLLNLQQLLQQQATNQQKPWSRYQPAEQAWTLSLRCAAWAQCSSRCALEDMLCTLYTLVVTCMRDLPLVHPVLAPEEPASSALPHVQLWRPRMQEPHGDQAAERAQAGSEVHSVENSHPSSPLLLRYRSKLPSLYCRAGLCSTWHLAHEARVASRQKGRSKEVHAR